MFDLEKAIAAWRRHMVRGGINSVESIEELESHLRDEVEAQIKSGASPQDAFKRAVATLGEVAMLRAEFAKVTAAPDRLTKFLQGSYLCAAIYMLLVNLVTLLLFELSWWERVVGFGGVLVISAYLASVSRWLHSLTGANVRRFAGPIKAAANLVWVWPLLALLEAEHVIHLRLGILPMMLIWCFYTAVVLTAVAYALIHGRRLGGLPPASEPQPQLVPPTRPCPPEVVLPGSKPMDPSLKQSFELACEEASRLGHDYLGTEHLLLGIFKGATANLAIVLRQIHVDYEAVRTEIERLISPIPATARNNPIPLTPRAQKAIRYAAREAKAMKRPALAPEHLLLGLLLEHSGIGGRALRNLGVKEQTLRDQIVRQSGVSAG